MSVDTLPPLKVHPANDTGQSGHSNAKTKDQILKLISFLEQISNTQKMPKIRALLESGTSDLRQFLARVSELDGVVDLDASIRAEVKSPTRKPKQEVHLSREDIQGTRLDHKLVDHLLRSGITPQRATVFSREQVTVAKFIVDKYESVHAILSALQFKSKVARISMRHLRGKGPARNRVLNDLEKFARLTSLLDLGALKESFESDRRGFWADQWSVQLRRGAKLEEFCRGHWMSCFSNVTVLDHLGNNGIACDSLTNVELDLPAGSNYTYSVGSDSRRLGKFELDLCAQVASSSDQSTLLIIESKSGRLENIEIDRTLAIIGALKERFAKLNLPEKLGIRAFILIPPQLSPGRQKERDELRRQLEEHDSVALVETHEFGTTVLNEFAF